MADIMRAWRFVLFVVIILTQLSRANDLQATYISAASFPYAVTDAIDKGDPLIVAWASGYQDLNYGTDLADTWKTPEKALGPALGTSLDIVCLGRGGEITLTFTNAIRDGSGPDFCIFENGFSANFLELAWVEVSSNGVDFVRFPNFSFTAEPTGSFLDPTYIFGLASRYMQGKGMPFDLNQLKQAYDAALLNETDFSPEYEAHLESKFPLLDLNDIRYVRIVDIVGDGSASDSDGYTIYDAYPTTGSAGFDLEAVGVLNRVERVGLEQTIDFSELPNQRWADGSVQLAGSASSGLPLSYEVLQGPAVVSGGRLLFSGKGIVRVAASQPGDAEYAAAESILRSFVIADEVQHIYVEPISNQLVNASGVSLRAVSSSGLPVTVEVLSGPSTVSVGESPAYTLELGAVPGPVVIRVWQAGDATYAPAEDVLVSFAIVGMNAVDTPRTFAAWQFEYGITGNFYTDTDGDGVNDFQEYAAGSNPISPDAELFFQFEIQGESVIFTTQVSERAPVSLRVEASSGLAAWEEVIPEVISIEASGPVDARVKTIRLRLPKGEGSSRFWRCRLEQL
ncbi:MAG: hypothetical protein ACI81V_000312 [Lentimonas sp.]|jgi:hypothetical protein